MLLSAQIYSKFSHYLYLSMAVVLATVVLAGCSVSYYYNRVDGLLLTAVESYIDLRPEQRDSLKAALQRQLDWHRLHELPKYVEYLDDVAAAVADGLDEREQVDLVDRFEALQLALITQIIPTAAELLATLNSEQIAGLRLELEKRQQKMRDKYHDPDPEKRSKRRVKAALERVEYWVGDISDEQQRLIKLQLAAWPDTAEDWLKGRQSRTEAMLQLFPRQLSLEEWQTELGRLYVEPYAWQSDSARETALTWRRNLMQFILFVDSQLTGKQRDHVAERLAKWRARLRSVMAEA